MLAIPLIRTDDGSNLTPIDRSRLACEQIITALMMHGTLSDAELTGSERETYTTLSVATIIPAEA
ncbi:MAG: hypothetical protein CMF96_12465 [Candidatus Marinimicrobia bacterium]|nr:hypothetical protein [Candidatus Neomarinimicrobiota bacterium]